MVSVIVPAHDEAVVLPRLLARLCGPGPAPRQPDADRPPVRIVVVCNGCTDATAAIARTYPDVLVLETPVASKREALRRGDERAGDDFPRIYLDADVELGRDDVLA